MSRVLEAYPSDKVVLREVGLRDGLQLVDRFPSTTAKAQWIFRESEAGITHFEVGSFLPAKAMPQFADVRELIEVCEELGVHSAALALNERGVVDALETAVREIVTVVSATEEHSQANARRSREDALALVKDAVELAAQSKPKPLVQVGISMAFGCSISGTVDPDEVVRIAAKCAEAGASVIGLADTVGFAGPKQIEDLIGRVRKESDDLVISIHLHDTRGMGIANAAAALDSGVRIIDGSLGGLGGCPFAPGATGNVVIEDLVYLCERNGFATGIELENLIGVREIALSEMPDEPLYGALPRAGVPRLFDWRM